MYAFMYVCACMYDHDVCMCTHMHTTVTGYSADLNQCELMFKTFS